MSQNKKVIICVQVYNGEKYLRQCIESVLSQTYKNFEIYVIDNNSQDSSREIIEEYGQKDYRVIPMLCNDNIILRWLSLVDNLDDDCYFTLIDHDDWWSEFFLEYLVNFLEREHLDSAFGMYYNYYEKDNTYVKRVEHINSPLILKGQETQQKYFHYWFIFETIWGYIYKISILKQITNKAREILKDYPVICGDTIITLNYINECQNIGILNEYLYYYRQHDTNMSSTRNKRGLPYFKSIVMLTNEFEKFAQENGIQKIFYDSFFDHLCNIYDGLQPDEIYPTFNEIFEHEMTIRFCKLAVQTNIPIFLAFKSRIPSIINIYDIKKIDTLKNIIDIISLKSSLILTIENFEIIQKIPQVSDCLVEDNISKLVVTLFPYLKKGNIKEQVLSMIKCLIPNNNLINTINTPDFLLRYKKITENLLNLKLEEAFDTMTDTIMQGKKIDMFEEYITLYINLSYKLGIELGVLVGKLKLAQFLYDNNNIQDSLIITKELVEVGFVSDELDDLVSNLTNHE